MDLLPYIGQLLYQHNCVIIPGLGGFVTEYRAARIHYGVFEITPPDKAVAFNPRLDRNDGLLTNSVAAAQAVPYHTAEEMVRQFAERCHQRLDKDGVLRFPAVGKLMREEDGKIRFLPEERENFLEDSFGLPTLRVQPLAFTSPKTPELREPEETPAVERALPYKMVPAGDKWPKRYWWWAAASVLFFFGLWQVLLLTNQDIPMTLAKIIQREQAPVIEEGRAAFLHPLIPSLQRQMAIYGPTTTLTSSTPVAILPFNPDQAVTTGTEADTAAKRNDWRMQVNPTAIETLARNNPGPIEKSAQPLSQRSVAANAGMNFPTPENEKPAVEQTPKIEIKKADAAPAILFSDKNPAPPAGYYLVVGSFPTQREAEQRLTEIKLPLGQRAVLQGDNGRFRAGMFAGENQQEINSRVEEFRATYHQPDAWILRYRGTR